MMVWSRGIIFSQWLHNKKFSGLSEGIFDILISDQIRGGGGGEIKKICSKFENFYFFRNKKIMLQFYKIPLTVPTICHNISKTALILLLSFSEVEF